MGQPTVSTCPGELASPPNAHLTQATAADLLDQFELWTVLECQAVYQAACAPDRDLRSVRAVLPDFWANQPVLAPADPGRWHRLELRFHRAISGQSGNWLLAHQVARICCDLQATYLPRLSRPIHRPGTLWLLQCQHRQILSCIEAGNAEDGVVHTRAHLHLIRDQVLAALSAAGVL